MQTLDVFKYFAQFPNKAAVMENFVADANTPEYSALKAWANALPSVGRMPEINHFVFGQDVDQTARIIKGATGYFMFVEYGPQQTPAPDRERNRVTEHAISIIIGKIPNKKAWDLMAETLEYDYMEQLIYTLAQHIANDDMLVPPFKRYIDRAVTIAPIEPAFLFNAVGWQIALKPMSYKIRG